MQKFLIILLLSPILLTASETWKKKGEEGFYVVINFSANSITIEESLTVEIILTHPETYTVNQDKLRANLLKFVGLSEPPFSLKAEKLEKPSENQLKITYTLEPQIAGLKFLSFYDIAFLPKDPEQHHIVEIISDIFKVNVTLPPFQEGFQGLASPLLSLTERFPISMNAANRKKNLENASRDAMEAKRNVAIMAGKTIPWADSVGIFLFVLLLLIARMQPTQSPDRGKKHQKRALQARKRALKSLNELKSLKLIEKEDFDRYFVQLTDTVRKYIEAKYRLRASTQTTQEFLDAMKSHLAFDDEMQAMLSDFLTSSDWVKFAEHKPNKEECRRAHQTAKKFIEFSL